jgi:hypothetical protein
MAGLPFAEASMGDDIGRVAGKTRRVIGRRCSFRLAAEPRTAGRVVPSWFFPPSCRTCTPARAHQDWTSGLVIRTHCRDTIRHVSDEASDRLVVAEIAAVTSRHMPSSGHYLYGEEARSLRWQLSLAAGLTGWRATRCAPSRSSTSSATPLTVPGLRLAVGSRDRFRGQPRTLPACSKGNGAVQ